jgi:hypothetical protein
LSGIPITRRGASEHQRIKAQVPRKIAVPEAIQASIFFGKLIDCRIRAFAPMHHERCRQWPGCDVSIELSAWHGRFSAVEPRRTAINNTRLVRESLKQQKAPRFPAGLFEL